MGVALSLHAQYGPRKRASNASSFSLYARAQVKYLSRGKTKKEKRKTLLRVTFLSAVSFIPSLARFCQLTRNNFFPIFAKQINVSLVARALRKDLHDILHFLV